MTLLDAEAYDPARERKRKIKIAIAITLILLLAAIVWMNRYWPEERVVGRFFDALQHQDFEAAYGTWQHDPDWKQHPQQYSKYLFADFYRDWGPGGEWGSIQSFKIYASAAPPGGGSGVIVEVIVNSRAEHARVWVQKSDKTLSFSPY
jgi:hypothetical protein